VTEPCRHCNTKDYCTSTVLPPAEKSANGLHAIQVSKLKEALALSVAGTLNADQIPCVLWGQYLLNVHGVPSIIHVCISIPEIPKGPQLTICQSIDFVIPDHSLGAAIKTLTGLQSLTACPDHKICPSSSQDRAHATTHVPLLRRRIRHHCRPLSPIRDSVVPATTRRVASMPEEIGNPATFGACVRRDHSSTMATWSRAGCVQVGPPPNACSQVSHPAGSLYASVRTGF
jgi:hypothetical protein